MAAMAALPTDGTSSNIVFMVRSRYYFYFNHHIINLSTRVLLTIIITNHR